MNTGRSAFHGQMPRKPSSEQGYEFLRATPVTVGMSRSMTVLPFSLKWVSRNVRCRPLISDMTKILSAQSMSSWVTFCTAKAPVPAERASYSLEMRKSPSAVGLRSRLPVHTKSSLVLCVTGIRNARSDRPAQFCFGSLGRLFPLENSVPGVMTARLAGLQ